MILLIDNYDSFTYNLYQMIATLTDSVQVMRNDALSLSTIAQLAPAGIVLSPGPGRPEAAGLCLAIIRHYSGQIPILGICLGHQAIATAFGGTVTSADQIEHGKHSLIFHDRQGLYEDMPVPFLGARYHSLVVKRDDLPPTLSITAQTADGTPMGIQHTSHPTYGLQFHPESVLSEHGEILIQSFLSQCHKQEHTQ